MREYPVPSKYVGVRIDRYLRKEYPNLSLGEIFKALRTGKVKVNYKKVKENYHLSASDFIQNYLAVEDKTIKKFLTLSIAEQKDLEHRIYYHDDDIFVFYKKEGELMHKGSAHKYGLAEMFQAYFQNEDFHFVNRLDKGTSGLVLAGKNLKTVRSLSAMIQAREIEKKYYILVKGKVQKEFSLQSYLKKVEDKVIAIDGKGEDFRECKAHFSLVDFQNGYSLLEATLETGRTHQLRVQLSDKGFPIVGDTKYGGEKANRMYLHSHFLCIKKEKKEWDTGVPQDFLLYLNQK